MSRMNRCVIEHLFILSVCVYCLLLDETLIAKLYFSPLTLALISHRLLRCLWSEWDFECRVAIRR